MEKGQARIIAEQLLINSKDYTYEKLAYAETNKLISIYENDIELLKELLRNGVAIKNGYFTLIKERTNTVDNEVKAREIEAVLQEMATELGYNNLEIDGHGFIFEKIEDGEMTKRLYTYAHSDIKKEAVRTFFSKELKDDTISYKEIPLLNLAINYSKCIHKNGKVMDRVQDVELPKFKEEL